MQKIRVFLLDDHDIVRHGLRTLLEAEDDITVVGEAATVHAGLAGVMRHRPDVALLDARLPDGSGIEVARWIHQDAPEVHTLMLSSFDDEASLFAAFSAGVSGYVLKEIATDTLLAGIRTVASGSTLLAPAVTARMMERIRDHREDAVHGVADLSPQERRILELIGEGLTNREIGLHLYLSEKTIKNNVTSLLAKLGLQRRTQAAVVASRLRG